MNKTTPHWIARRKHAGLAFDGKLVVLGGEHDVTVCCDSDGNPYTVVTPLNDTWASNDGKTWTKAQSDDQKALDRWTTLKGASVWPGRNAVVVAGLGCANPACTFYSPGIWITKPSLFPAWLKFSTLKDGETLPADVRDSIQYWDQPQYQTRMVIFNDQLWIFGRNDTLQHQVCDPDCRTVIDGYKTHIWSSDGIQWTDRSVTRTDRFEIPECAGFCPSVGQRSFTVYDKDNTIVLIQPFYQNSIWVSTLWASANGTSWSKVMDNPPFGKPSAYLTANFQNKFWLFEPNTVTQDYIWFTSDGKDWRNPLETV